MIVVSDSSPLINLARIEQFYLLVQLFGTIIISQDVYNEVVVKEKTLPGSREVANAHWIKKKIAHDMLYVRHLQRIHKMGKGEASIIVLAKEVGANLVLIDERRAKMVALSENLNVMGTVGLLELSHKKNLIIDLREIYKQLKKENIWINEKLINDSLIRFGFKEL